MITAKDFNGKYLEYKGQPLVRQDDEIYFGDMSEKYILFMMIMGYRDDEKLKIKVPSKIMVQIKPTDGSPKVEKQSMVNSLTEALDLGSAWLERVNRS